MTDARTDEKFMIDKLMLADCTTEQIDNLNRYQGSGAFHPFTCGNRDAPGHEADPDGVLVATAEGWRCPTCDYRQDWAHPFMATEEASRPPRWPVPPADGESTRG